MRKIILISSSPEGRVAQQLVASMRRRDLDYEVLSIDAATCVNDAYFAQTIVLPRISPETNSEGVAALERAVSQGAKVVNIPGSWVVSRDKGLSYDIFLKASVATPATILLHQESSFQESASTLGLPFIVKPTNGTHGDGIVLVRNEQHFVPMPGLLAQAYVAESNGKDIRVVVVNGQVIAAMERQAAAGDFRANLHLGASAQAVMIDDTTSQLAVAAAAAVQLDIAGVDIIMSEHGPEVLECNPSPGIMISDVTRVDVVDAMIDFVASVVA